MLEHCLDPPVKNNSNNNNNNNSCYLYLDISNNDCILRLNNVTSRTEFERYSLFKTHIFAQYNYCNCGKLLHMSHED